MTQQFAHRLTFVILLLCQLSICLATEIPDPNESSKYLDAVRTFADINAKRKGYPAGDTPLHSATRAGRKDIVELLIAKGANLNAKNNEGQTSSDLAISRNRKDIIDLFVFQISFSSLAIQSG